MSSDAIRWRVAATSAAVMAWRGLVSMLGAYLFFLGYWWCRSIRPLRSPQRMSQGCVFILPGIQGTSPMEYAVARGLVDGGVECGIEVFDWTTRLWPLFLFHLRASFWHRYMARRLAARIRDYQRRQPGRPVFLIGHSGGGGIALLAAELLDAGNPPAGAPLAGVVLLAAAVSPLYDVRPALRGSRQIWNFCSPLDCLLLGLGTMAAGTMDGWHLMSAGCLGFFGKSTGAPGFHQRMYRLAMLRSWNGGGHFGCVNRLFIAHHIAPLLREAAQRKSANAAAVRPAQAA
jgi:pimeloyl-ACP methyl ester carboxylesterase